MSVEVKLRKNETIEKAQRRFKKKIDREKIILDSRNKRYFRKPSFIKREKIKVMRFNDMLKNKREAL